MKKLLLIILFSLTLQAKEYKDTIKDFEVVKVRDGDTFVININNTYDVFGSEIAVRIRGIDTPEKNDERENIRKIALEAHRELQKLLTSGKKIELYNLGRDKYFRLLASVKVDNIDIGEYLIKKGLLKNITAVKNNGKTIGDIMRFRKSIRICKGLRINLSKSGISTTIGGRGSSFNFGKNGVYWNTSILGTGFYDRKKILGGSKNQNSNSCNTSNSYSDSNNKIFMRIDDDSGDIDIIDENGEKITDTSIINKLKRSEKYKQKREELYADLKEKIDNEETSFIDVYKLTPQIIEENTIIKVKNDLRKKELNKEELYKEAVSISKGKVKLLPILTFFKRKKEFINNEFDNLKILKDKELEEEFNNAQDYLNNMLLGKDDFVNEMIEKAIDDIELPIEFSINFEYNYKEKSVYLDLDLPEIEDIPNKKADYLASGKLKIKEKTQKELKEDYLKCVCGLAFFFSSYIFNVSSRIENILVSAYTQRINKKTGNTEDNYIYSILIERNKMSELNFENIDTVLAFDNFRNITNFTSTFEAKTITPANNIQDILNK